MTGVSNSPLSPFEFRKLANLLRADCTLAECHGVLSAVLTAPSMLPPSVWYPLLVAETPVFADPVQAQESMGLLMRFHNEIAAAIRKEDFRPYGYPDPQSITHWCRGYLRGSRLDQRWWADETGRTYLIPLAVLAEEFDLTGEEDGHGNTISDTSGHMERYREALPDLVEGLYDYWSTKRGKGAVKAPIAAEAKPQSIANKARKVGPNEPCPCGSGKKHKKCCGGVAAHK